MQIYGAGLAGLLAANMLRRHEPIVNERQPGLPNNHHALLRFRTDSVSRATGIPFRKVRVQKAVHCTLPFGPVALQNMYSHKVTGKILPRSIMNLEPGDRWIAPPDFIHQMARSCHIQYSTEWIPTLDAKLEDDEPVISTIPLPVLMKMANWQPYPEFEYRKIWALTVDVFAPEVDVYQTIYYPGEEDWYRASLTGRHLDIEFVTRPRNAPITIIERVLSSFGIHHFSTGDYNLREQQYGKITPIAEPVRKQFILAMTDLHRIYSIGRFATWRNILLDDVVQDISLVEQFVTQRDSYAQRIVAHQ